MSFLFRVLSTLSLPWLHHIGALLGMAAYYFSSGYREHLRTNIRLAMGADGEKIIAAVARESGKQMVEMARIWLRPLEQISKVVVSVEGWEHVKAARQEGHGVLYLTPHIGCFEIVGPYLAQTSPLTCLYRPPKNKGLQTLIRQGRERGQMKLAPADLSGVRALVKALKKGEDVALLPDQAPKTGEGVWLDFFGRPAYTMTLAARLSETKATTLLTWGERLPHGKGYRLHFSPLSIPLSGDTLERAAHINREIEQLILACPTQYLWGYNRYKRPAGAEPPPQKAAA